MEFVKHSIGSTGMDTLQCQGEKREENVIPDTKILPRISAK